MTGSKKIPYLRTDFKDHKAKTRTQPRAWTPCQRGSLQKKHSGMRVYIKIASRSAIECIRNLELKMPSKKHKITRSSFKEVRIEKYIAPLASCYRQKKTGIFDPSQGYTPREVCAMPQRVLHSRLCTSCASNQFRRTENFRNTGNWWDPYGGSKPWSCLN